MTERLASEIAGISRLRLAAADYASLWEVGLLPLERVWILIFSFACG